MVACSLIRQQLFNLEKGAGNREDTAVDLQTRNFRSDYLTSEGQERICLLEF